MYTHKEKTYCMADIHGEYDRYIKMLEKINFQESDCCYVLGDVIDRSEGGIKILQDMMLRPNVYPILGNHEYMVANCMNWLLREITEESMRDLSPEALQGLSEWMSVGGSATIREFAKLSLEEREYIIEYLSEFALYEEVSAGERELAGRA